MKLIQDSFLEAILGKKIDVFFTCASFEKRCFVVAKLMEEYTLKKAIVYFNTNEYDEILQNANLLFEMLKVDKEMVDLNSDNPIYNYAQFYRSIVDVCSSLTKPNILIDTTTFTHESLLLLIRLLQLKADELGTINYAYVGAKDYSTKTENTEEKWLSKGIKEIRTILGYSGLSDPTQKNHLMILFGFESERTKKMIEEYQFDFVTLGFGSSPIQENHYELNQYRHQKLLQEFSMAKHFSFSLSDPFETKHQILEYLNTPDYRNLNTVIAPMNNKLSTIGAGLAAIENENIQLAYAKPLSYNINGYSDPNEFIYFGELKF